MSVPKPAVRESPKQRIVCAESCADGEGCDGICSVGAEGAGAGWVVGGTAAVVSALLVAGLQPVSAGLTRRDAKAAKAKMDRLGATRGWVTAPF
jgi:hypothetical protein